MTWNLLSLDFLPITLDYIEATCPEIGIVASIEAHTFRICVHDNPRVLHDLLNRESFRRILNKKLQKFLNKHMLNLDN